jgi:hypothetical protein
MSVTTHSDQSTGKDSSRERPRFTAMYVTTRGHVTRVTRDENGMLREVRAAAQRDLMERIEITHDSETQDGSDPIVAGQGA